MRRLINYIVRFALFLAPLAALFMIALGTALLFFRENAAEILFCLLGAGLIIWGAYCLVASTSAALSSRGKKGS